MVIISMIRLGGRGNGISMNTSGMIRLGVICGKSGAGGTVID